MKYLRSPQTIRALAAPLLLMIVMAGLAQGGTLDFGDITSEASALLNLFEFIGAIVAVIAIIFSALAIRGRNVGEGIVGLACAIGAIFILEHAQGWVTSITGISLS